MRRLIAFLFLLAALCAFQTAEAQRVDNGGGGGGNSAPANPTIPGTLTITAGGTAQDVANANASRVGMVVQNPSDVFEQGLGQITGAVPSGLSVSASGATTLVVNGITYAPGDTITLSGGTHSQSGVVTVATTGVSTDFAPTVTAGGSGCTNNAAAVLTGTTGTTSPGGKFQLIGVISGNALQSVTSIYYPGYYTTNPTVLTAEPVTATGCSGVQVSIKMGPSSYTVATAGKYSAAPANPVSQASTSGSGTGATVTASTGGNPEDMTVNVAADATLANGNFCNLPPGDTCNISINGHPLTGRVSVNAATTGHAFNATYGAQ